MESTVTISLEKYDELINYKYQDSLSKKEIELLIKCIDDLKKYLLESNVNDYNIRHYELDEIVDFNSYNFGLDKKISLLNFFTKEEMIEFIEIRYKEYKKGQER